MQVANRQDRALMLASFFLHSQLLSLCVSIDSNVHWWRGDWSDLAMNCLGWSPSKLVAPIIETIDSCEKSLAENGCMFGGRSKQYWKVILCILYRDNWLLDSSSVCLMLVTRKSY